MTEKQAVKEIMRRASTIRPTVHVGKEGLSEGVALELKEQIKRAKIVKVKVLGNSPAEVSEVAESLAEATGAVLVDVRGSIALFCDKREHHNLSMKKKSQVIN